MNQQGITKVWSPSLRSAVESLIEKLKALPAGEPIEIDAGTSRDPNARFVRLGTGEIIGEINMLSEFYEAN